MASEPRGGGTVSGGDIIVLSSDSDSDGSECEREIVLNSGSDSDRSGCVYHISIHCIRTAEPRFLPHELVIPDEVREHLTDVHKGFIFASLGLRM